MKIILSPVDFMPNYGFKVKLYMLEKSTAVSYRFLQEINSIINFINIPS